MPLQQATKAAAQLDAAKQEKAKADKDVAAETKKNSAESKGQP